MLIIIPSHARMPGLWIFDKSCSFFVGGATDMLFVIIGEILPSCNDVRRFFCNIAVGRYWCLNTLTLTYCKTVRASGFHTPLTVLCNGFCFAIKMLMSICNHNNVHGAHRCLSTDMLTTRTMYNCWLFLTKNHKNCVSVLCYGVRSLFSVLTACLLND